MLERVLRNQVINNDASAFNVEGEHSQMSSSNFEEFVTPLSSFLALFRTKTVPFSIRHFWLTPPPKMMTSFVNDPKYCVKEPIMLYKRIQHVL